MAEVIHVFGPRIFLNGVPYAAQVVGRPAGHIWEGWIEFASDVGTDFRRTRRETTQPNREALEYWAGGLSGTYLEGALARTLEPLEILRIKVPAAPYFDAPAASARGDEPTIDRAVLDPFSVGAKGEVLLRQELSALRDWHLRNIVRAYNMADPTIDLDALSESELVEIIVSAVQAS